jgi:hypothetical protein
MSMILLTATDASLSDKAWAHHGWSSYDATETVNITAPLAKVKWENPIVTIYVVHDGARKEISLAPISRMMARGLEQEALVAGKTVVIEAWRSTRNAKRFRAERITVDGKMVELR